MRTPSTGMLILLAGAGLGVCVLTGWVTATGTASGDVPLEVAARVLMIGLPIGVGLFAWSQPASARFGRNLTLTGFVFVLTMLSSSTDEVVYGIGRLAGWAVEVWIVYLVLSFPSGRLAGRPDRVIVALAVALVVVLYFPTALLVDDFPTPSPWASCVTDCPANPFQVTASEPGFVESWVRPVRELLTIALFLAATVRLATRMSSASPLVRTAIGPVVVVAAARLAIFALTLGLRVLDEDGTPASVGAWLIGSSSRSSCWRSLPASCAGACSSARRSRGWRTAPTCTRPRARCAAASPTRSAIPACRSSSGMRTPVPAKP
jgi:hypothetical protein